MAEEQTTAPGCQSAPAAAEAATTAMAARDVRGFALLAGAIALGAIVLGAAVSWLSLIELPNRAHQSQLEHMQAGMLRDYFDARLITLRSQMERLATAPETVSLAAAAVDGDALDETSVAAASNRLAAHVERLTAIVPHARRIEIFPPGRARVDLNGDPPILFAGLELIETAEREDFAGPEAFEHEGQGLLYVARPVMDDDGVLGVLFATLASDYFAQPLARLAPQPGRIELRQELPGAEPRTVLSHGEAAARPAARIALELDAPHWSLIFTPGPGSAAPIAGIGSLAVALALIAAGTIGGILLAARRLQRSLEADAASLSAMLDDRRSEAVSFRLSLFEALARRFRASTQPAPPDRRDAPARSGPIAAPGAQAASKPAANPAAPTNPDTSAPTPAPTAEQAQAWLDPHIFRAYDIRGIVGENLTEDALYWIGRAFASESLARQCTRAVVAGDGRLSSPALRAAFARGVQDSGVDVVDIGEVPTPLLYYATHALELGTGAIVTGSHNPPEYNGLKMMIAGETLAEGRISALRERIETGNLDEGEGGYEQLDLIEDYIGRVAADVAVAQPLKVALDCGNGVAGAVAPRLLEALGCEVVPLFCEVDGRFPNHHPDPAESANLEDLIRAVKDESADLGLAFDGDGDRLGVVTNSGAIVWPDRLLMLFSRDIVGRNPGADVIFDIKCSRHLGALISEYGGRPIMWKTGHSHMKAKLRETGALLAGEFSGHICFGERWYGFDDALYSAARLLEIVASEGQTLDELFAGFPTTFMTPEIKVATSEAEKFGIIERLAAEADFGGGVVTSIDGVRVDYDDGWGLARPSNTSPVLTLRFEADSQDALDRIQKTFQEQLQRIAPSLSF